MYQLIVRKWKGKIPFMKSRKILNIRKNLRRKRVYRKNIIVLTDIFFKSDVFRLGKLIIKKSPQEIMEYKLEKLSWSTFYLHSSRTLKNWPHLFNSVIPFLGIYLIEVQIKNVCTFYMLMCMFIWVLFTIVNITEHTLKFQ